MYNFADEFQNCSPKAWINFVIDFIGNLDMGNMAFEARIQEGNLED